MPRLLAQAAAGKYLLDNPPPTARDVLLTDLGIGFEHQYLFEGGAATFDDDEEGVLDLTIGGAATHAGDQLLKPSVDSINMGNAGANYLDYGAVALPVTTYIMEVWFRQPDLTHTEVVLIGTNAAVELSIGSNDGVFRFPTCRDNTGAPVLYWESEIDFYGDNKPHQLIEAHEIGNRNNYTVIIDGMPVASGTNGGYLVNFEKPAFNGAAAETAAIRSGADFGAAYFMDNGADLTLEEARNLFVATRIDSSHSMLTNPQWFILDSDHTTLIGGDPTKCKMDDVVFGQAGINSGIIPRNGKVYFELLFILQGDNQFGCLPGIRKIISGGNVYGLPPSANDLFHLNQSQIRDGTDTQFTGTQVTNNGNIFPPRTGEYYQFAIDWDTGDWWVGHENTWIGGGIISNVANPSTGAFPLGVNSPGSIAPLDLDADYCVNLRKLSSFGNSECQIVTASADFFNAIPTGFTAWDDAL